MLKRISSNISYIVHKEISHYPFDKQGDIRVKLDPLIRGSTMSLITQGPVEAFRGLIIW